MFDIGFISKQPNGLYCQFSTILDKVVRYNMTAEEYVEMCAESARATARNILNNNLQPFSEVKKRWSSDYQSKQEFEKILVEMGDKKQ